MKELSFGNIHYKVDNGKVFRNNDFITYSNDLLNPLGLRLNIITDAIYYIFNKKLLKRSDINELLKCSTPEEQLSLISELTVQCYEDVLKKEIPFMFWCNYVPFIDRAITHLYAFFNEPSVYKPINSKEFYGFKDLFNKTVNLLFKGEYKKPLLSPDSLEISFLVEEMNDLFNELKLKALFLGSQGSLLFLKFLEAINEGDVEGMNNAFGGMIYSALVMKLVKNPEYVYIINLESIHESLTNMFKSDLRSKFK